MLKKGDEILIKATVKFADECGGMVLAETDGGEDCGREFYVDAASILRGGDGRTYEDGLADAWEVAGRIVKPVEDGGFYGNEIIEIFGNSRMRFIFGNYTAEKAMAAVKGWEDKKAREAKEIHVGDVVVFRDGNGNKGIVTAVGKETETCCVLWQDGICNSFLDNVRLEKTGRSIDIEALLSQIGDDE